MAASYVLPLKMFASNGIPLLSHINDILEVLCLGICGL